jgi:hypothetical protein
VPRNHDRAGLLLRGNDIAFSSSALAGVLVVAPTLPIDSRNDCCEDQSARSLAQIPNLERQKLPAKAVLGLHLLVRGLDTSDIGCYRPSQDRVV